MIFGVSYSYAGRIIVAHATDVDIIFDLRSAVVSGWSWRRSLARL